ncbi:MAG: DUF2911 domain-containing protein [Thermoanaerobaculia bacterium]
MRHLVKTLLSLAAVVAAWLLLTSYGPPSWIATWAPCPRNWAWLPAWLPRKSPLDALAFRLDDTHVKVCYGRPSLRGRKVIGGDVVPFGRLWRTGANEPTTIHVDGPIRLGGLALLPGSYSLYTIPQPGAWTVIVNRSIHQWGLESEYTDAVQQREVGRFTVRAEPLDAPLETLAFRAVPSGDDGSDLLIEWESVRIRISVQPGLGDLPDTAGDSTP